MRMLVKVAAFVMGSFIVAASIGGEFLGDELRCSDGPCPERTLYSFGFQIIMTLAAAMLVAIAIVGPFPRSKFSRSVATIVFLIEAACGAELALSAFRTNQELFQLVAISLFFVVPYLLGIYLVFEKGRRA